MEKKKKSDKPKIARGEISLRTLSYYQKQGGFYNEIITILLKLRDDPATARCLAPNKVMNEASWLMAVNEIIETPEECYEVFKKNWSLIQADYSPKDCNLIKCVFFIILIHPYGNAPHIICPQMDGVLQPLTLNSISLCNDLHNEVTGEKLFYPKFKHLLNPDYHVIAGDTKSEVADKYHSMQIELVEARFKIEKQEARIKELTEIGLVKDAENAQLRKDLAMAQDTIACIPKQSALDSSITFARILKYIRNCKQYKFTTQIFMLLNWLMRNTATDEEYQMLDETQQYMQEQKSGDRTTVINNDNKNCNVINEANDPVFGNPLQEDNE